MNSNINLASKRKTSILDQDIWITRYRIFAAGSLFIVGVIGISVFLLILGSPLSNLRQRDETLTQNLASLRTRALKYAVVKARVNDIQTILKVRPAFDKAIEVITSSLPSDVTLTSISIEKKTLSIVLASSSLHSLDTLMKDYATTKIEKKVFTRVLLNSFVFDVGKGNFIATFAITLP